MDAVEGTFVFCKFVEIDWDELNSTAQDNTLPPPPAYFPGERSNVVKEPCWISCRDVLKLLPGTR